MNLTATRESLVAFCVMSGLLNYAAVAEVLLWGHREASSGDIYGAVGVGFVGLALWTLTDSRILHGVGAALTLSLGFGGVLALVWGTGSSPTSSLVTFSLLEGTALLIAGGVFWWYLRPTEHDSLLVDEPTGSS